MIQEPSKQVTVHVDDASTILNVNISMSTLPYTIAWFVDGFKIQESQKYVLLRNGSLKINSIDQTDSGYYQTIFIVKEERLLSTIKLVVTDDIPGRIFLKFVVFFLLIYYSTIGMFLFFQSIANVVPNSIIMTTLCNYSTL